MQWDDDLIKASEDIGITYDGHPTETLVRVGERIGKYIGPGAHTGTTAGTTTAPVAYAVPSTSTAPTATTAPATA